MWGQLNSRYAPKGYVFYDDTTFVEGNIKIINRKNDVMEFRPKNGNVFIPITPEKVDSFGVFGKTKFIAMKSSSSRRAKKVFWEVLARGEYTLLRHYHKGEKRYHLVKPNNEVVEIPKKKNRREKLMDKLVRKKEPIYKNRYFYKRSDNPLIRFTNYLNDKEARKFPVGLAKIEAGISNKYAKFYRIPTTHAIFIPEREFDKFQYFLDEDVSYPSLGFYVNLAFDLPVDVQNSFFIVPKFGISREVVNKHIEEGIIFDVNLKGTYLFGELNLKKIGLKYAGWSPYFMAGWGAMRSIQKSTFMSMFLELEGELQTVTNTRETFSDWRMYPTFKLGVDIPDRGKYVYSVEFKYNIEVSMALEPRSYYHAFGVGVAMGL